MPNPPRSRRWSLALGLCLLSLLLFVAQTKKVHEQNWLDRVVLWVTAPVQQAVTWAIEGGAGLWHRYVWLGGVEEENLRLKTELAELQGALGDYQTVQAENQRLRELAGLRSQLGAQTITGARVVGLGTSPATRVVRIDAGSADGVQPGDAVVAGGGLVGRVSGVTAGWSEVLLVVDSRSAVDAVVETTRSRGIVRGRGDDEGFAVDHLVRTAEIKSGDLMVTSGIGGVFPAGLRLGTVSSVSSPKVGVFREAELRPAVDFTELEELLVVRSPGRHPEGGSPAQERGGP